MTLEEAKQITNERKAYAYGQLILLCQIPIDVHLFAICYNRICLLNN